MFTQVKGSTIWAATIIIVCVIGSMTYLVSNGNLPSSDLMTAFTAILVAVTGVSVGHVVSAANTATLNVALLPPERESNSMNYPPPLLADFYKLVHVDQYPKGTERVYSTWIPRASRIPAIDEVVAFGFQAFIKKYFASGGYFDEHFFQQPESKVIGDYERLVANALGVKAPNVEHLRKLHQLGYMPLEIRAVPEGTVVPLRVPMLTIENTVDHAYWVTNFVETLFSCEVWQAATSATLARRYRQILDHWAEKTGGDLSFVPFQGHDFSMRGMENVEAAAMSGMGHLLSFVGTDTIPAILAAEMHYGADISKELIGTSIPATEHSVMCAHGQDEATSFKYLISEVYPSGFVSIVSDTWDLWNVITNVVVGLKDDILARDGKVVLRPDSGNPADIICGDPCAPSDSPAFKGVIELLWDIFGGTVTNKGYKVLDSHIGAIYGDAISLDRVQEICARLASKGFASTNMVYGIGSYTYQYQTRDTFSFALKSTWVQVDGVGQNIFKDPVTDDGTKKSLKGRVAVLGRGAHGGTHPIVVDELDKLEWDLLRNHDMLEVVYKDGQLLREQTFADVRKRLELVS